MSREFLLSDEVLVEWNGCALHRQAYRRPGRGTYPDRLQYLICVGRWVYRVGERLALRIVDDEPGVRYTVAAEMNLPNFPT